MSEPTSEIEPFPDWRITQWINRLTDRIERPLTPRDDGSPQALVRAIVNLVWSLILLASTVAVIVFAVIGVNQVIG